MKTKLAHIFVMVLLVIGGFFLVLYPSNSLDLAVLLLGIGMIVLGGVIGISYLAKKSKEKKDLISAIFGGILIILGIVDLIIQKTVINIFPTVAGILVILGGIVGIVQSVKGKNNRENWKSTLAVALVSVALGAVMFVRKFDTETIVRILGTALLYLGAVGVVNHLDDPVGNKEKAPTDLA